MKLAPTPLVLVLASAAACGSRTDLSDLLVDPDATVDGRGVPRGGSAGDGALGATGGVSGRGGTPAAGGRPTGGIGGMLAGSGGGGRGGTSGSAGKAPVCGDGILGPGEACEPGSEPPPPALELRQGTWRKPIRPLVGPTTAATHYAYDSRSSHTGFEAPEKSSIYLYRWAPEAELTLVLLNGIDADSSGLIQPPSDIAFDFTGLPATAFIALSDDDIEFTQTSPTTALALWDCDSNSDGGLIAGLPLPSTWHLTITPTFRVGITTWSFFSGGPGSELGVENEISLNLSEPIEIVANDGIGGCRDDCTVPRCGDGILDPGEVCDDGNTASGDGCEDCRP